MKQKVFEPYDCMMIDEDGRELISHGTVSFPIAIYDDDIMNGPVPWHWHEELEAGYITEGAIEIAIGSEKKILHAGDGFFVNSGVLHGVWSANDKTSIFKSMVFHPRIIGGSLDSVYWQNYISPLVSNQSLKGCYFFSDREDFLENLEHTANHSCDGKNANQEQNEISQIISYIREAWEACNEKSPGYEFAVRDALSKMIFQITKKEQAEPKTLSAKVLRDNDRIKAMLQFIHDHFGEELHIEQIAMSASISVSEALRCFKTTIGTTPIQYMKQYRIQKAADLLTSTDLKVEDIGALCGFQEMSYFAKVFRETKGMVPTKYRDTFENKNTSNVE